MRFIWKYIKPIKMKIATVLLLKAVASFAELLIPYVLEYIIDEVVLKESVPLVLFWGAVMIALAVIVRMIHVFANHKAVRNATDSIYKIREDLFIKTMNLSGTRFDSIGLASLTSRMTSDSYNVQTFVRMVQTMGIRAPMLLIGGITITLIMDPGLAAILCIIAPIMIFLVVFISFKGIPLYDTVQRKIDDIVRVMRENITGVRVVKALSKEDYETKRFYRTNEEMTRSDVKASVVMALPGPIMTLFLNCGLTLVVYIGAIRVNNGVTEPGVILAFLTYFNMVLMGVMGVNRLFMLMSKANASAKRIEEAVEAPDDLLPISEEEAATTDRPEYIVFDNVTFGYNTKKEESRETIGGERQKAVTNIDFAVKKGGSLGIIGATGCGKTTLFNLLMRFYDTDKGHVFIDGRDVRTFEKDELHSMFGVVFQNDVLLAGSIKENIIFGREVSEEEMEKAAEYAASAEFIKKYEDAFDHNVTKLGSNLSGGQKQRVLISRALVANPKILLLDDSSSALDYRTDANVRKAIKEHYPEATTLVVAQRISSIMNSDEILVMDEGRIIGRGTHEYLLENCDTYKEIYMTQMGE